MRHAISRGASIVIVVVVIIIVIVGGYAALNLNRTTSSSSSTLTSVGTTSSGASSPTSSSSSASSSSPVSSQTSSSSSSPLTSSSSLTSGSISASGGPQNRSQLVVAENEPPNSYDPSSGFFAGEDEILVNTYQELVMFNYTSLQEFAPILAQNWTISANYLNYSLNLRNDAYFANGHLYNSSVAWFNFNRVILMGQIGAFYFTNLIYNGTTAFATGYSISNGLDNALVAGGYQLSTTNSSLRQKQAAIDLAAILSSFNPSNSTIQKIMSYPNQAIVATGTYSVKFNLVNPYLNFLQVLSVPGAGQVDPSFVDAHGGVAPNTQNTYVNTHTMGTGPYQVQSYIASQVATLVANPNY